jgi:peptidoglycan/LPS O-acetylase OafA/YrhL
MRTTADEAVPAHEQYLTRPYFPELDGMRAFSVLLVISFHMKDHVWDWLAGGLGVQVFFVVSGFLITMLALREERSRGTLNIRAFYVRRIFRILPLYYVVLGLYCLLIFGLGWNPEKRAMLAGALPYYLTFFQEYPLFMGVNGQVLNKPFYQSWSLGIEEKFYFVWPFLGFILWRHGGAVRRVGTAVLAVLTLLAPVLLGHDVGQFFYSYGHILVGCLVALLLDDPKWFARFYWLRRANTAWAALAIFLTVQFAIPHISRDWEIPLRVGYTIATALLIGAVVQSDSGVARTLRQPLLVWVGRLSYGMYLIHLFASNIAQKLVPGSASDPRNAVASLAVACLASIVMAYLLAVTIERPFIALGRRLSRAILQREATVQSANYPNDTVRA